MSFPICYDIYFVYLTDNRDELKVFSSQLLSYWTIRDWFALYCLFEKHCIKYGLCKLEIRPCFNEAY